DVRLADNPGLVFFIPGGKSRLHLPVIQWEGCCRNRSSSTGSFPEARIRVYLASCEAVHLPEEAPQPTRRSLAPTAGNRHLVLAPSAWMYEGEGRGDRRHLVWRALLVQCVFATTIASIA